MVEVCVGDKAVTYTEELAWREGGEISQVEEERLAGKKGIDEYPGVAERRMDEAWVEKRLHDRPEQRLHPMLHAAVHGRPARVSVRALVMNFASMPSVYSRIRL